MGALGACGCLGTSPALTPRAWSSAVGVSPITGTRSLAFCAVLVVTLQLGNRPDIGVAPAVALVASKHVSIGRDDEFGDGRRSPGATEDASDDVTHRVHHAVAEVIQRYRFRSIALNDHIGVFENLPSRLQTYRDCQARILSRAFERDAEQDAKQNPMGDVSERVGIKEEL